MKLNGTAKTIIPIATVVALIVGLHVLQQGELGAVRDCSEENKTAVARVEERTDAQFDEILRSLARIEKELE
jgi:hypothetical protein